MANPGFPQQPMQQPPMSGAPQGAVPAPKPVKKGGTSKMVPIVVSAGLAVGTFCGLLFGVGLGEANTSSSSSSSSSSEPAKDEPKKDEAKPTQVAKAEPAKTEPAKTEPAKTEPAKTEPASGSGSAAPAKAETAAGSGSAAKTEPAKTEPAKTEPAAGSGSAAPAKTEPAKAGTGSGSATPAKTEPVKVADVKKPKLTIELTPAVAGAKVTVDGKPVDGATYEVDLGKATKKEVKIVVKANGYKTAEQKVEVDSDLAVKIELVKRPVVPSGGGTKPPPGKTDPKKKPPGGLIDI